MSLVSPSAVGVLPFGSPCGPVEWRGVMVCGLSVCLLCLLAFLSSSSSSSSSSVVLVFGVVRAQLCEHARCPRTPLCLSCFIVCSSFCYSPLFFCLSVCVFGMAVCVYHVSVCCVGMTATGSLSLSPSFFW